jgi:hypothetical protein
LFCLKIWFYTVLWPGSSEIYGNRDSVHLANKSMILTVKYSAYISEGCKVKSFTTFYTCVSSLREKLW